MTKKIVKAVSIICALIIIGIIAFGVISFAKWKKSDEYIKFDKKRLNEVYTSLTILDNEGKTLNEPLYIHDYKQVPLDALNDYTYKAFISIEDKRFYNHGGIDYKRVIGALAHNIKSGNYKEGASTISQQLIKNTHLNNNKTLSRKINEMLLAKELEKNYSKHDILEMYLNTIYFGRNAYGIESAANVYFNKSAKDLTVSESAVLAGMIKAPNTYAPDKNADKCLTRRNSVLKTMLNENAIDEKQYTEALQSEITYKPQTLSTDKSYGYHVMQEACQLLNMTPMQLAQSNFVIETYCNSQAQSALQELVKNDNTADKKGKLTDLSCVLTNNNGGIEACYFRGESGGNVRQAGSTLKPIAVYAPALNEHIITQASPILDEETNFNGYKPSNSSGYNGWTTIKYSVAKSLNIPAVKTLNALTLATAEKYLNKMGIDGEQNLSLALGNTAKGINIFTLAKCYETLAKNGICDDLRFIKNIYSENGLVYSRKHEQTQVYQPVANYLMTDMLINAVASGTAQRLRNNSYQIAAKTGTVGNADGNSDAIIAGYTTQNTFVCWYSGEMSNKINGATAPCTIANSFLNRLYKENKPANFTIPHGIVQLQLDKEALYKNQKLTISDNGEKFAFDNANKPKEHVEKTLYDYTLYVDAKGNNVTITLPNVENCVWRLYNISGEKKELLTLSDNRYEIDISQDEEFIADLTKDGQVIYTTPRAKAIYAGEDITKDNSPPSILDFWYLK